MPEEGAEATGRRFQEEVQAVVSVGSAVQSAGSQHKPCQSGALLSVLLL